MRPVIPTLAVRDKFSHFLIEAALTEAGIPVQVLSDEEPPSNFHHSEIKEILAYLHLAINYANTPSLVRILEGRWKLKEQVRI
jgi:superfamily I DNA/RNA helicase